MQELSRGEPREHKTGKSEGEPEVTAVRSGGASTSRLLRWPHVQGSLSGLHSKK